MTESDQDALRAYRDQARELSRLASSMGFASIRAAVEFAVARKKFDLDREDGLPYQRPTIDALSKSDFEPVVIRPDERPTNGIAPCTFFE